LGSDGRGVTRKDGTRKGTVAGTAIRKKKKGGKGIRGIAKKIGVARLSSWIG